MKRLLTFLLIVVCLTQSLTARTQTPDSLILKNGQVLVGALQGWNKDVISFFIFDAGMVSVDPEKISMLKGNLNKYRIETSIRKLFYSTLTCTTPGEFTFVENGSPINVPFNNIEIITPYKKGGITHGYIGLGYNYAKSNGFGLVALEGGINFSSQKWLISGAANSSMIHTKANGLQRNREYMMFTGFRTLNTRWQIGSRIMYQRNTQLGLTYRHLVGAGMMYNAIMKPNCQLYLFSGLIGTAERTLAKQSYNRMEIPFVLNLEIYKLGNSNLSLSHTQSLYVGIGTNNRIRHDGELRLNTKLTKKLSLTTYLYDNYDSAPVLATAGNIDYGWNTGIKLGF